MFDFNGKLSALDAAADIMDPFANMLADPEVRKLQESKATFIEIARYLVKQHKEKVVEILARLETEEGMPPEEYIKKVNIFTLYNALIAILNNPEMASLFGLQAQTAEKTSSGPATETTEVSEK